MNSLNRAYTNAMHCNILSGDKLTRALVSPSVLLPQDTLDAAIDAASNVWAERGPSLICPSKQEEQYCLPAAHFVTPLWLSTRACSWRTPPATLSHLILSWQFRSHLPEMTVSETHWNDLFRDYLPHQSASFIRGDGMFFNCFQAPWT